MTPQMVSQGNLSRSLPDARAGELEELLASGAGVRVCRITSLGQASPPGFWYEQAEEEWVLVVSGRARLEVTGEVAPRELGPGDWVRLPAGCRHRVAWTHATEPTVWLAVYYCPMASRE